VAAQLLLNKYGADRGVDLNLLMKFLVVRVAYILEESECPLAEIAPRRIKRGLNAQRFAGNDGNQVSAGLEPLKLPIVINPRKV